MSFESQGAEGSRSGSGSVLGGAGRQPRSLTLTFAETHPWERLVRDRLNSLPRGYLKRFVLLLIERAGVDMSTDEAFRAQVERALLTRELPEPGNLRGRSQLPLGQPIGPYSSAQQAAPPDVSQASNGATRAELGSVESEAMLAVFNRIQDNQPKTTALDQQVRRPFGAQAPVPASTVLGVRPQTEAQRTHQQTQTPEKDGGFGALEL